MSGLTWFDGVHLLATHDAKNEEGKLDDPRVSILTLTDDLELTLTHVEMDWDDNEVSDDMESVCTLSAAGEFLASESGQEGAPFTRVFRLSIEQQGDAWTGTVVDVYQLPSDTVNVEGIECLGERRTNGNDRVGRARRRGSVPRRPSFGFAKSISKPANWRLLEETVISVDNVDWTDPDHRDISDLYLDSAGALWAVATEDPADAGPWRSVIYQAGPV